MKIRATQNTWLKLKTVDSAKLANYEKRQVLTGDEIDINWMLPDQHQHHRIELKSPLQGRFNWYLYQPHWKPVGTISTLWRTPKFVKDIVVPNVPYFAQVDSNQQGYRQCFAHSVFMAIAALKTGLIRHAIACGFPQPENYYLSKLNYYGDTTDNQAHIKCLQHEFNIDAYFTMTASPADLQSAIALSIPVPIGVSFKSSGHWVLLKGIKNGNYLINDSYGVRAGATNSYFQIASDQNKAGENDIYSPDVMDRVFWDGRSNNDRECGWAIMITAIDRKPTGIHRNL